MEHDVIMFQAKERVLSIGTATATRFIGPLSDVVAIPYNQQSKQNITTVKFYLDYLPTNAAVYMTTQQYSRTLGRQIDISPKSWFLENNQYMLMITVPFTDTQETIYLSLFSKSYPQSNDITTCTVVGNLNEIRPLQVGDNGDSFMLRYEWQFYSISAVSETASLNFIVSVPDFFTNTMAVFVSDQFTTIWNYNTTSLIPNPTIPNEWMFQGKMSTYFIAVYGKACTLRCSYSYKSFLTDDTIIFLGASQQNQTIYSKNLIPNALHFTSKVDLSQSMVTSPMLLKYKIYISQDQPVTVYLRKNAFPTTGIYDYTYYSISCKDNLEGAVPLIKGSQVDKWYFGYTSCCDMFDANITFSLEPIRVLNKTTIMNESLPIENDGYLFGLVAYNTTTWPSYAHTVSSIVIFNHTLDLTVRVKFNDAPVAGNYDVFRTLTATQNVNHTMNYSIQIDYIFSTSGSYARILSAQESDGGWIKINDTNSLSNETQPIVYWSLTSAPTCTSNASFNHMTFTSLPFAINAVQRNIGATRNLQTNGITYNTSPFPMVMELDPIWSFYASQYTTKQPAATQFPVPYVNISQVTKSYLSKDSIFRIEFSIWDLSPKEYDFWNKDSVLLQLGFDALQIQNQILFNKSIVHYDILDGDRADRNMGVKFTAELTTVQVISKFVPSLQGNNASRIFIMLWGAPNVTFEASAYFIQDKIMPATVTMVPLTIWALVGITCVFAVILLCAMSAFSCKFYEKLIKHRLTTFDKLSDNDPFCFLFAIWFSLLGNKASRRAKQIQILVPACLLLIIGTICSLTFGLLSYDTSFQVHCCGQTNDVAFRVASPPQVATDGPFATFQAPPPAVSIVETYGLDVDNSATVCFTRSSYQQLTATNVTNYYDHGASEAALLCFRNKYSKVQVKGSDSYGVIATLTGGICFILSFILFVVLLVEMFLSSWYFEKALLPRMTYYIMNE
jgi:uncharacterized membrane protein